MLISLHLPKTAGTSFLAALEQHFGDRLHRDYDDQPLHSSTRLRRQGALRACLRNRLRSDRGDVDCIHGHFLILKYRLLKSPSPLRFVTWMRDPVERLASHYHYWRRTYDPDTAGALHQRVVEDDWDLDRFCLGPELRNVYATFLWGFPLSRFDFVGITEHFSEDMAEFASVYLDDARGAPLERNVNSDRDQSADAPYIDDAGFRRAVEAHHKRDVALYKQALKMRDQRRSLLQSNTVGDA